MNAQRKPAMTIHKLREHIGAEVSGVDLRQSLDEATQGRSRHKTGHDFDHSQYRLPCRILVRGDRPQ